jgi:hypothetical protein
LRPTYQQIVEGARPNGRAIARKECPMRRPRDIFSRSERRNASLQRLRSGGQMPPVGEITEKTEDDWRFQLVDATL